MWLKATSHRCRAVGCLRWRHRLRDIQLEELNGSASEYAQIPNPSAFFHAPFPHLLESPHQFCEERHDEHRKYDSH